MPSPDLLVRVLELIRFLRGACPWDAAQTPRSLLPYLLEEAREVADAVNREDDEALPAELGDLLLNVGFQIVLAEERGAFPAADVVARLEEKMRRRHPQLYGEGEAAEWEELKARERPHGPWLSGIPTALEPLSRAHRIQERVSVLGFDWREPGGALDKVAEELAEVRGALAGGRRAALEEELGDLLFSVVNLTRLAGSHAMTALEAANAKFASRFAALERLAANRGLSLSNLSLADMEALWEEAKRGERQG